MRGIDKLKAGEFNNRSDTIQADGSSIITLWKRGEDKVYRFQVRDLYGEHEEVLWEEVIEEPSISRRGGKGM